MENQKTIPCLNKIIQEEEDAKLARELQSKEDKWMAEAEHSPLDRAQNFRFGQENIEENKDFENFEAQDEDDDDDDEDEEEEGLVEDYFVKRQNDHFQRDVPVFKPKKTEKNPTQKKELIRDDVCTLDIPPQLDLPASYDISTSCGRVYKNRIPRPITTGANKTRLNGPMEVETNTGVPGLFLVYNFLSEEQEKAILAEVETLTWHSNRARTRRVQLYVPWQENPKFCISPKASSPLLPKTAVSTALQIKDVLRNHFPQFDADEYNIDQRIYCELQVNEYGMEDALGFHKDNVIAYREVIFGVSLLCDCWIHYQFLKEEVKVLIPRRSLYLLSGKARYKWKHGIPPNSLVGGDKRLSLTFRKVQYSRKKVDK